VIQLSDLIKNILRCVLKMNESLLGLEQHNYWHNFWVNKPFKSFYLAYFKADANVWSVHCA